MNGTMTAFPSPLVLTSRDQCCDAGPSMFRKHLSPLNTFVLTRCRSVICYAYKSVCAFIALTDSCMARAVDPKKFCSRGHGCVPVSTAHLKLRFAEGSFKSVSMVACVICVSCFETSYCITRVITSTSMIRLEVMTTCTTVVVYNSFTLLDCDLPTKACPL